MNAPVEIADYDPGWPGTFAALRDQIAAALGPLAQRIEHVGSTAVPGLPAKPIIDLDVVIAARTDLPEVIIRLGALGYRHQGDLGITGREAFTSPAATPAHHLYVCTADSRELARHLAFRDHLRTHPGQARAYAELKRSLAARFRSDRDAYSRSKAAFIEQVLAAAARPRAGADSAAPAGRSCRGREPGFVVNGPSSTLERGQRPIQHVGERGQRAIDHVAVAAWPARHLGRELAHSASKVDTHLPANLDLLLQIIRKAYYLICLAARGPNSGAGPDDPRGTMRMAAAGASA